jgi:GNAT superfamily N-acetyltransferase
MASLNIRTHGPGDLGWVVQMHGELYAAMGYNPRFEAMVAELAGRFLRDHDPERECCWIAELDGVRVGAVMLVRLSEEVGKLRLLIVSPEARNHGVGSALVKECLDFARAVGYKKVTLWTHANLKAARRLYEAAGFRLSKSEQASEGFGLELVDEYWDLDLRSG